MTFTLAGGGTCGEEHPAVLCTSDGRALSNTVSIGIRGQAAIAVADAEATEGTDANMAFRVSLDRAALQTITRRRCAAPGAPSAGRPSTRRLPMTPAFSHLAIRRSTRWSPIRCSRNRNRCSRESRSKNARMSASIIQLTLRRSIQKARASSA